MASFSGEDIWEDTRTASRKLFASNDNVFSRSSMSRREVDDEEALKWAAIEKLPTYNRLRTGILKTVAESGHAIHEEVLVTKLGYAERHRLVGNILRVAEEDNERFLLKLRERLDKVGIDLPKIEVRFEHLSVEADAYLGSRALPTLFNFTVNILEDLLGRFHLLPTSKRNLKILQDVSGIVKPSRMTLLLGPPGSGRTTLLLALAGKLDPDLRVSGKLTYNGHEMTDFVPQTTSAYISQRDMQLGEMTVRETLDFCGRCQGVGTRYEMLKELSRREKEAGIKPDLDLDTFMKAISMEAQETSIVTDYMMKILGLDICADTLVGDAMRRGVSGGQRKRVTIGEMLVGPAKALFMDEISTGLDSSTTYQIVKCLRQYVHVLDGTTLVSLLQPAPETFDLFEDVILLSEGHIVYQGPRCLILDFFEAMGFKCPERKRVADFLQEVTSRKDQEQYWADGSQPYRYVPPKEFAESFSSFQVGESLREELSVPFDKSRSHPAALSTKKYGLDKWEMFKACFWRECLLMKRNSFIYAFKTVQISIVSIITMTVFFRTNLHPDNVTDGNLYLGAIFYGLITIMFNSFAELSMSVSRLPVFYKERDQMFYPAWAVSIPTFITRIPLSILESGIWVCLTYFVIGFAPEAGRFFRQFFMLFLISQMGYGLFRFLGAVGRSMVVAMTYATFALLGFLAVGGFLLSRENIPKRWIWAYWISPLMYGQTALSVNEFLGERWNKPSSDTTAVDAPTIGKAILKARGIFIEGYWFWISVGALIGFTFLFNVLSTIALAYLNPLGKPQANIAVESLQEKHLNQTGQESSHLRSRRQTYSVRRTSIPEGIDIQMRNSRISSASSPDQLNAAVGKAMVASKRGMVLPFQPLAISFNNMSYYVDMPSEMRKQGVTEERLQLLSGVSGAFRPGILTALMGVSGAGKTTLMDVLAGRKTGGYIEGDIRVSGYPKKQETFARISGYCEQNDIHSPNVTVRESLIYSAWLRLANETDEQTRMVFVDEVIELVELNPIRDALVGLPGVNGLSTEQRKRLTIAVELVANPSIIFMDEPTSGLDARAAAIVMRAVQNTVNTGRTVVCTIHQPSIDIFEAFDELLLMKCGGKVIYAGPLGHHSQKLIEYFEAIPGVPKIKQGHNPATWMLDISQVAAEARLDVDFAQIYKDSSLYQHNHALIEDLSAPAPGSKDLHFPTKFSQNFAVQFRACLWKQHWSYWRNPDYNVVRIFCTLITALVIGSLYWNLGSKTETQQDVINIMGGLYLSSLFLGVCNTNAVAPIVDIERTVFYRERAAGMYSSLAYVVGQVTIEIPYILFQTVIYATIIYSMVGFQWTLVKFFWCYFFMFSSFLYFTLLGMMNVAITPNHQIASILSTIFYNLWVLFSGFLISRSRMPVWWRWYYWADPLSWTVYGLVASQLGDLDDANVEIPGMSEPQTVTQYLYDFYGFRHDFLGVVAGVHVGIVILFLVVFAVSIKTLNFQQR